jgi:Flp pilus assembly protein TadD
MSRNLSRLAVLLGGLAALAACANKAGNADKPDTVIDNMARSAALAAESNHDYEAAAGNWNILFQRHPDDPELALALARDLRHAGHLQPAIDAVAPFIDRHGATGPLLAELGKDYLAADRLGLAAKSLEESAALAPQRWDVPSTLGIVYDIQNKPDEAATAYAKALALSPDNPEVLNNLALSQALSGKLDAAIATLRHANEQPASGAQVRQNLAMLLALKGDPAAAERLARHDLTPEMARANSEIFRNLAQGVRQ